LIDPAVLDYYDRTPEESRLAQGAFRLEEARTRELIGRFASPPPGTVLDVGGAAGPYALWLAEHGYTVHLVDAVPPARGRGAAPERGRGPAARILRGRRRPRAHGLRTGASIWSFCSAAVSPHRRGRPEAGVPGSRPGAAAGWAASGGRHLTLGVGARRARPRAPGRSGLPGDRGAGPAEGQHRNPTDRPDYFTTAYFHHPDELAEEVRSAGLLVEGIYGIEGPGWMLPDVGSGWRTRSGGNRSSTSRGCWRRSRR
jgi:hypothetical protein